MRNMIFFVFLLVPFLLIAQQIERVTVNGVITSSVPGEDLEGISIYNTSSQKGTITNAEGEFIIDVAVNDRVLFTALQFQKFTVIVDEGIVDTRQMKVYVNPAITQLDEVIVRPHDLTGNIKVDVSRIKTVDIASGFNLTWEEMEFDFEFSDDKSSGVENSAIQEVPSAGLNMLAPFALLADLIFKPKDRLSQPSLTPIQQLQLKDASFIALQQRFPEAYYSEILNIPDDEQVNFIYFVIEQDFTTDLLKENNELKLMDFLEKQSQLYIKR
ncbi:MAG: carboxypeptidase-like regulatory domain-containing protein [Flavobacteriaceae bacterium]